MRPRSTLLALALMIVLAYALRGYLLWARVVPTDNEDLSQASWLQVHYSSPTLGGMTSLQVRDPQDVEDVLSSLRVTSTLRSRSYYGGMSLVQVDFHFENGAVVQTLFANRPDQLRRQGWGQINVDPAFYGKIRALISKKDPRWRDPLGGIQ